MKKLFNSKSRILIGGAILLAILSVSNSCTKKAIADMTGTSITTEPKGSSSGPGANEVWILGSAYSPSTITVSAGTTVTWTNFDSMDHTVTSNTGLFDSGTMKAGISNSAGGTFSFTFSSAGTYPYYCTFHRTMTATVVVN